MFKVFSRELPIIPCHASLCFKNLHNRTDKHKFKLNTNESYTATFYIIFQATLLLIIEGIISTAEKAEKKFFFAAEAQFGSSFSCNFHHSSTLNSGIDFYQLSTHRCIRNDKDTTNFWGCSIRTCFFS